MSEQYRPLLPSEKRLWKIRNEPRGFEYQMMPLWSQGGRPRSRGDQAGQQPEPEQKMSVLGFLGLLFLTFLDAIIDLPDYKELGIEGGGK